MFILCADETNLETSQNVKFFIYGGLAVPAENVESLTHEINELRSEYGFKPKDSLKYRTSTRPRGMAKADWNAAKSATIEVAVDHDATLIACLVLHKIAGPRKNALIEFQLNTVLDEYNLFLSDNEDCGIVLMDRLDKGKEFSLMRERFTVGSATPWGTRKEYPNVVAYGSTCDGASHLNSVTDVALGTLGYCVNQRGDLTRPKELFPKIEPLIWRKKPGNSIWLHGLVLNPRQVKVPSYEIEYDELKKHVRKISA